MEERLTGVVGYGDRKDVGFLASVEHIHVVVIGFFTEDGRTAGDGCAGGAVVEASKDRRVTITITYRRKYKYFIYQYIKISAERIALY
ncbi:hypothetical protein C480_12411 [Natrialba aegyptia DSM 13077]|uniref:Uncharacterized protein n=2 Tax=Natrialba aegyptia TaxID=129789 RepID=M0B0K5_9EURY|nr:hypothetical protein C480_12411 [Natrialba aegyptia DSM 13077]